MFFSAQQIGQPDIANLKSQTTQPDLMPENESKQTSSPFDLVQDQGGEATGTGWDDDDDWLDNPMIEPSESAPEHVEQVTQPEQPSSSGKRLFLNYNARIGKENFNAINRHFLKDLPIFALYL